MKRILLYKDAKTGSIYTLSEMKQRYEIANNCNLPITDDEMESILRDQLWYKGGNLFIISCSDPILKWCHEYAEEMEAERYLTKEEIEASVRDIYSSIYYEEIDMLEEVIENLKETNKELIDKLILLCDEAEIILKLKSSCGKYKIIASDFYGEDIYNEI